MLRLLAILAALWLVGCEISTGRFPYTMPPVIQALAATPARPDLGGLEDEDAHRIACTLDDDPKKRPTASELVTILERSESPS
jgi:hypothetical protein